MQGRNENEITGIAIIKRAVEEPLRQIVYSCGLERSVLIQNIIQGKNDYGFNARRERYENLLAVGVIDPAKVSQIALEHAASVAAMLLTTECVISDKPKNEGVAAAAPQMRGMDY